VICQCGGIGRPSGLKIRRTYHAYRFESGHWHQIRNNTLIDSKNKFENDPYLKVYHNIFEKDFCQQLIEKYEFTVAEEKEKIDALSLCKVGNKQLCYACDCLRIDITQHDRFAEDIKYIYSVLNTVAQNYFKQVGIIEAQVPSKYGFEVLRLKRYLPNTSEGMMAHVDVRDQKSAAKRFLTYVVYLNDEFKGGRTIFHSHKDIAIKPVTGSVLIFPPLWPWLHEAEKVKGNNPKYILGSYLHYTV
jgi:Rps23 Pro-64 3,4-dihydroxylase Tpa1-like proline 4-hydroxylase